MNLNQFSNFSNESIGWHSGQLREKAEIFHESPKNHVHRSSFEEHQRPVQTGLILATKASTPSWKSLLP